MRSIWCGLDPQWRCLFSDGAELDLVESSDQMAKQIGALSDRPQDAEGYLKFLHISERLHDVSDRFFFWRSVGGIRDAVDLAGAASPAVLSDVLSLRFGRSVAGLVRSHFKDERVAQMIDHFTQYVGSSPAASPAVLCGIAHMQTDEGVWYPPRRYAGCAGGAGGARRKTRRGSPYQFGRGTDRRPRRPGVGGRA